MAPSFVGEQAIGLVVIGTLCRSGIRGMLIGNTAESILSSLSCDVLTVEPKGFVSPVGLPDEERSSGPQD